MLWRSKLVEIDYAVVGPWKRCDGLCETLMLWMMSIECVGGIFKRMPASCDLVGS